MQNFIDNPDKYVLRLKNKGWFSKEKELTAEKRGLLTLLWARVFCRSQYNLPEILHQLSQPGKQLSVGIDVNEQNLRASLEAKVHKYTSKHEDKTGSITTAFQAVFPHAEVSTPGARTTAKLLGVDSFRAILADPDLREDLTRFGLSAISSVQEEHTTIVRIYRRIVEIKKCSNTETQALLPRDPQQWTIGQIKAFLKAKYREDFVATFSSIIPPNRGETQQQHEERIRTDLANPKGSLSQRQRCTVRQEDLCCLPDEIQQLQSLTRLTVAGTHVYCLPQTMNSLRKLVKLAIPHNRFLSIESWTGRPPNLTKINTAGLSGALQEQVTQLNNSLPELTAETDPTSQSSSRRAAVRSPTARPPARPTRTAQAKTTAAAARPQEQSLRPARDVIPEDLLKKPSKIWSTEGIEAEEGDETYLLQMAMINAPAAAAKRMENKFLICDVPGDGNCLFAASAISLLAKRTQGDLSTRLAQLKETFQLLFERKDFMNTFPDLDTEHLTEFTNALFNNIDNTLEDLKKTPYPESIINDDEAKERWSTLFRLLSVATLFEWATKDQIDMEGVVATAFHNDDAPDITINGYLTQMALGKKYGAKNELCALQSCFDTSIHVLDSEDMAWGESPAQKFPRIDTSENVAISDLKEEDVVLFLTAGHYSAAFLARPQTTA